VRGFVDDRPASHATNLGVNRFAVHRSLGIREAKVY